MKTIVLSASIAFLVLAQSMAQTRFVDDGKRSVALPAGVSRVMVIFVLLVRLVQLVTRS